MNKKIRMFAKGMFLLLASVTSTATMAAGTPTTSGGGKAMAAAEESSTATGMPENGKTYYIYCDNATQQFFYNNGGTLAVSNGVTKDPSLYTFTCTVTAEGKYQFQNVSNSKYFGFKAFSASAYNYTVEDGVPSGEAVHLKADAAGKYLVMKEDGGFDQSTNANYTKTDNNIYSANYIFVDASACNILSFSGNAASGATITWNGETKSLPCSYLVMPGTTVTDAQVALNYDAATLADATLKYEGVFTSAGVETTLPATYDGTANASYEIRFMPDVFSSAYGEKWVRVINARISANGFTLPGNTSGQIATNTVDPSNLDHLWCLVGDYKSFKIYSHTSETQVITHDGTPAGGEAVSLQTASTTSTAQSWQLADYTSSAYPGYAIEASGSTANIGLNPHGGVPKDLKFFSSTDDGSKWKFLIVDTTKPVKLSATVTGTAFESNPVADITITSAGSTLTYPIRQTASNPTGNLDETQIYLYKDKTFTASSFNYRGFDCEQSLNGNPDASMANLTLEDGMSLSFNYTANGDRIIFTSPDANGKPYRIPAITTALNGDVIAVADNRPCGNDIGYGEVDIKVRISKDNGATWSTEAFLADGDGDESRITDSDNTNNYAYAYGDAAIVADRESNKVVVFCVAGKTVCHNGNYIPDSNSSNPNRVAKVVGTYNESTSAWEWTEPVEVTEAFYSPFVSVTDGVQTATVKSLFIGSGRIMQSRVVKKGAYYRLYAALWTKNEGNRVVYSDDFGETWNVLGTINDRPASSGDEPKCEELPDGTVVLSSRRGNGRYFNLFTFASTTGEDAYTTGTWGTVATGISNSDSGTNGEIYLLKGVMDQKTGMKKDVMLQSVPLGSGRNNVSIWYKEIDPNTTYTPATFAAGWTFGKQVSFRASAYSTLTWQNDGRIGFLFEEVPGGYCIIYCPITVAEATGGAYALYDKAESVNVGVAGANEALGKTGPGYPKATAAARTTLQTAIATAQSSTSDDTDAILNTLATAVTAYKATTADIQLPEDGKAYTFCNVTKAGAKRYLKYEGEATGMKYSAADAADATVFVCRDLGEGKFVFVCNDGKYLIWRGSNAGGNSQKGYCDYFNQPFSTTHQETTTDPDSGESTTTDVTETAKDWPIITLAKMTAGGQVSGTQEALFGYLTFRGRRQAYEGNANEFAYTVVTTAGDFDQASVPFFNDNYTSATLIEETAYPNSLSLTAVSESDTYIRGLEAGTTICTFSAPFPTVIPANAQAFYATSTENGATMKAVTAAAIPANQGVVMVGQAGFTSGLMVPVTTEEVADLSGNVFAHTAGAPHVLVDGDFILANSTDGLAFYKGRPGTTLGMNRAYIPAAVSGETGRAFTLNFGEATGIGTAVSADDAAADAPVFDLTGRRVNTLRQGSLYIKGGQKFIAR